MLKKISCIILFILFSVKGTISAYDKDVIHPLISKIAAENSVLALENGNYLRNIGFEGGLKEPFLNNTVEDWIQDGSTFEDANRNYFNHFHNPLKAWQDAGLDIDLLFINPLLDPFVDLIVNSQSSLLWAQHSKNEFSWQNIREYFYDALTTGSEASFAKTFEGLGHLIHLLQDAAQPAHVRNDAHPLDGLGLDNGLETWAKNHPGKIEDYASSPEFPTVDLNVYIYRYEPITQFFDTDTYTYGTNPSTALNQGIAEYTNANFVSDDTIFTENFSSTDYHYFPFPRREDTVEYDEYIEDKGKYRTYFKKIQNGEEINHLAAMERIYKHLDDWPDFQRRFIILDSECHKDYAQKLIPRAVGYSARLIDYFFRGRMGVVMSENQPSSDPITEVRVKVKNATPDEETGAGKIVAVASSEGQVLGVSRAQMVTLTRFDQELVFDFKKSTIPADTLGLFFTVVYRGPLGLEDDAVIARGTEVSCIDFTADVVSGSSPLTVQFTVTTNPACNFDNWLWDFGDGNFSEEQNPTNIYTADGAYTVVLTAWDETSSSRVSWSSSTFHKFATHRDVHQAYLNFAAATFTPNIQANLEYTCFLGMSKYYTYRAGKQTRTWDLSSYSAADTILIMTVYDIGRVDIDESAYSSSNFPVLPSSGTYKYIPVQNITGSAGQMVSNFVQDANGYQEFVNIPLGLYDTVGWKGGYYFIWAHKFSATKGEKIKEDYIYVGD
jgi:hypothetical protein